MLKHLGAALGPGGAVTESREGAVGGFARSRGPGETWVPVTPRGPAGRKPAPLYFLTLTCRWHLPLAELSCHPGAGSRWPWPPGAEKQAGDGGWLDLGGKAGRQWSASLQGPSRAWPPQVLQPQGTPGLGLRKLESVDQGVPGLASPSPRQAAPCPRGMCGWAGSSAWGWKLTF